MKLNALIKAIEDGITNTDSLIETYSRQHGADPLDLLVEKERRKRICEIICNILHKLPQKDRRILFMIMTGFSVPDMAEKLKIDVSCVYKRINKFHNKILKKYITQKEAIELRELLEPEPSTLEAHAPEDCGFPFEWLMNLGNGGEWGLYNGRKTYRSKKKCFLPEYFQRCFKDNKTHCSLCAECKRKDAWSKNNEGI